MKNTTKKEKTKRTIDLFNKHDTKTEITKIETVKSLKT